MVNYNETPGSGIFEYMSKMLSSDQLVHINRPNHLPIMLLHKKFYNLDSPSKQTNSELQQSMDQVKDAFQ